MTPEPGLARCIGDVSVFAERYWGRRPLVIRAVGPFDDLLGVAGVEALLVDLGRWPTFRVVLDGEEVPASEYTRRTRVGVFDVEDVADVDLVLDLVARGATVVVQGLQRYWQPIAELCLAIESEVSHAVHASAALTPPEAPGLGPHTDDHDVIILQVAGTRRWDIAGLDQLEMAAGDAVYVPARTARTALPTAGHSLHITLGLLATTHRQVLRRLLDDIDADELDRPLPLGFTRPAGLGALVEGLEQAVQATVDALGKKDLVEVANAEVERRARRMRTRGSGRLEFVVRPDSLTWSSYVRRCNDAPLDVIVDTTSVVLQTSDRRLRLPAVTADALHFIAAHEWFRVADLPGLDDDDRLTVVRRLVREGILELA